MLASDFIAEIEILYTPQKQINDIKKIESSYDAFVILSDIWADDKFYRERFYMLCLNNANKLVGFKLLGIGTHTTCCVDVKSIVQTALLSHSTGVVIAHNHPSCNTNPSVCDKNITDKIKNALSLIDIKLLDHIIMCDKSYFSFVDNGLI